MDPFDSVSFVIELCKGIKIITAGTKPSSLSPSISHQSCNFNCKGVKLGFYGVEKLITSCEYRVYCANCVNLIYGFDWMFKSNVGIRWRSRAVMNVDEAVEIEGSGGEEKEIYDSIVNGSGIGGLVAATQLAMKGAKFLVLEKYLIPGGGSSGFYEKDGYTFDVGSSVMFGFSENVSSGFYEKDGYPSNFDEDRQIDHR